MFSKTNVELENLTPELAASFAALPPVPGERDLKSGREAFLRQKIAEGTFAGPTWAKGLCREDGKTYRLDGQHSSHVLTTLPDGIAFPTGLMVTIETYTFDNLHDDGPALFDLFNNPRSARTNTDMMGIFRAHVPALEVVDKSFLVHIGNGIAAYEQERENGRAYMPRQRGLYFEDKAHAQFAIWAWTLHDTLHAWMFAKSGVVATMLEAWMTNESEATEFWSYVLREDHPEADHETRELSRTLKDWSAKPKTTQAQLRKKTMTVWKRYRRLAQAA